MNKKVKFVVLDVDGTLTDGKIYMSNEGELFKVFNVKDGAAIKDLLLPADIIPIIITARESEITKKRCNELGIKHCFQKCRNKIKKISDFIKKYNKENNQSFDLSNVAYCGDDLLDLKAMVPIKKFGGSIGCPQDAIDEIIQISDFVSSKKGGNGAVREFIEWLLK